MALRDQPAATDALRSLERYDSGDEGELLGLEWKDIDLEARTLAVRRQLLEHSDGSLELGELKTRASRRRVDLPGTSIRALEAHRARAEAASPDGLVFTDSRGGPVRKGNLLRRWFRPLLKRAGLRLFFLYSKEEQLSLFLMKNYGKCLLLSENGRKFWKSAIVYLR